jgi:exosome complex component MTR3
MRDNIERDLGSHLENALSGVIILDRYPKSALDITVLVLEGEEDCLWNEEQGQERGISGVGLMNVLAGSINVAVAALVDAKIDCLDLLSSGVAARAADSTTDLLDPCPSEHESLACACVVGYLPARDEVVEIWSKIVSEPGTEQLSEAMVDAAIKAARGSHKVQAEVIKEYLEHQARMK